MTRCSYLVVMTMISTICSHTMRQKSAKVFGKGPESQKCINTHRTIRQYPPPPKRWPLTLGCDVGVTPLVPVHEAAIDVI